MAPSVDAVETLLGELRAAALPRARKEHEELTAYAREKSGDPHLALSLWDLAFWAERLREERYAYSDEELRPYFSLPRVLEGLFATARRLFEVEIRQVEGEATVWDPSVRFFQVTDLAGHKLASFYLDPYSRPENKRGGAWMDVTLSRKRRSQGDVRLPVAYLICNMTPPVGDRPSLMTFREVETLFHEFGHGLQHMLTTVDHAWASGINNVEWDAVELPSQFMENWCYTPETMAALARHLETGEPLPGALFEKIVAARTYRSGSMTLRQVYFATLDLALHRGPLGENVLDLQRRVAAGNTVVPPLAEDRFLCAFSHIFAGGYAAGYYSYKWAEVLSADAFFAFKEAGLGDRVAVLDTGRRFRRTVLSLGGSVHPMQVFEQFRGRQPSTRPLLELTGLL
jgi:oligopeptidase A